MLHYLPTLAFALSLLSCGTAKPCFSRIVSYGDSLSDTGNLFRLTGTMVPPAPYYKGHFSDGKVWVEYLANTLNVPLVNYAFGAATISNQIFPGIVPGTDIQVPSFSDQVNCYLYYSSTYVYLLLFV